MSVEAYEVGQRSDKRGVNLISDALPVRSAVVWRASQTQSATQLTTRGFAVAHTML